MNINMQSPSHLEGVVFDFPINSVQYFCKNKTWFDALTWKGKLRLSEENKFKILFSGKRDNDGFVYSDDDLPLVIKAISRTEESKEIVIFDQRFHGINFFLTHENDFNKPSFQEYKDENGMDEFEVYIYINTSCEFEDEFDSNDGLFNINDVFYNLNYLKFNAFDFLGVLISNKNHKETKLTEIELM